MKESLFIPKYSFLPSYDWLGYRIFLCFSESPNLTCINLTEIVVSNLKFHNATDTSPVLIGIVHYSLWLKPC